MSTFVSAKLVKLETSDGLVSVVSGIELGKTYIVDVDSIETIDLYNLEFLTKHSKTVIHLQNGSWIPLELLELQVN